MPGKPDGDDRYQDRDGNEEIALSLVWLQTVEDRSDLQTDEDEGEDVQREDHRFPDRIRGDARLSRYLLWRFARHRDRITNHRQHTGQSDVFREDPHTERGHELQNNRRRDVLRAIEASAARASRALDRRQGCLRPPAGRSGRPSPAENALAATVPTARR